MKLATIHLVVSSIFRLTKQVIDSALLATQFIFNSALTATQNFEYIQKDHLVIFMEKLIFIVLEAVVPQASILK